MPRNLNYEHYIEQLRNFIRCCHCQRDCHPNPILCTVCDKQYHYGCLGLSGNAINSYSENNGSLICSYKCSGSFLPLGNLNENEVISLYYGNGDNPCKKCRVDCVESISDFTRCYTCNYSIHIQCIKKYNPNKYFFCGDRCEMAALPFSNARDQELLEHNIINHKKEPKSHFLDLKCVYVEPNKINDDFLALEEPDINIFHNNISSLNANFHKVEDIFHKCQKLPDILAFTETRLNNTISNPDIEGYKFEAVHSPTSTGGVGVYISNKITYSVKKDLALNTDGCEDLWLDIGIKNKEGGDDIPKFIVGVIYRHPDHQYIDFLANFCNTLQSLNKIKANYIVVGDFNINLTKYKLVPNVTNYVNYLNSMGSKFFTDKPTRVTSSTSTCLDHVYTNIGTEHIENHIIISETSDHSSTLTKIHGAKTNCNEDPDKWVPNPNEFVNIDHFLDLKCAYVDPNKIDDDLLALEESSISIFHNNISSLNANFHKFEEIFHKCQKLPDILAFSETRLNNTISNPDIEGYKFEAAHSPTSAGGVGIYISNKMTYTVKKDLALNTEGCEDLWLDIDIKNKRGDTFPKFIVGVIYRHPDHQYIDFLSNFCNTLHSLNKIKANYIIVGDFNINLMKYKLVSNVTNYVNSLNSMGCKFFTDKPTRVTSSTSTCIDHVYSNIDTEHIENHILISDASDHFSTLTKIHGAKTHRNEEPDIYRRKTNLSDIEWGNFNAELNLNLHQKLSHLSQPYDVNHIADQISGVYKDLIDKYMPLKKLTRREKRFFKKPWITRAIQASIAKKNILFRKSKSTPTLLNTEIYTKYRNVLNKLKKTAKNNYYKEKIASYGQNKSKTWKLINQIGKRKRKSTCTIHSLHNKRGHKISDTKGITDILNKHFGTIGEDMASKFNDSSIAKDPIDFIPQEANKSILLSSTDVAEIMKLILKLDNKKACGYDHISNRILKSTVEVIAPFIVVLFNSCIKQGIFPDAYKTAHVIPLFKGGDKEDPNCYRPISLLPAIGKLLEKVVSVRVVDYFEKFNMFCPQQFGFRARFSTEYAILDINEKLLNNLDKKLSTCSIFLDLAKAFDSVSHEILLRKMEKYGIRGKALMFFKSYLSTRNQIVSLNNTLSSSTFVKFGVPQGSILGPLLFLIFINDLPHATKFFVRLFADDTFLCAQNENISILENEVNTELQKVHEWLVANKLTLNVKNLNL